MSSNIVSQKDFILYSIIINKDKFYNWKINFNLIATDQTKNKR